MNINGEPFIPFPCPAFEFEKASRGAYAKPEDFFVFLTDAESEGRPFLINGVAVVDFMYGFLVTDKNNEPTGEQAIIYDVVPDSSEEADLLRWLRDNPRAEQEIGKVACDRIKICAGAVDGKCDALAGAHWDIYQTLKDIRESEE